MSAVEKPIEVDWNKFATLQVFDEVMKERDRQDAKFGIQNLNPFKYQSILVEEVGEVAKATNDSYDWKRQQWKHKKLMTDMRTELIQVAAVAVAMVECLDRNQWPQGKKQKNPDEVLEGQMAFEGEQHDQALHSSN